MKVSRVLLMSIYKAEFSLGTRLKGCFGFPLHSQTTESLLKLDHMQRLLCTEMARNHAACCFLKPLQRHQPPCINTHVVYVSAANVMSLF